MSFWEALLSFESTVHLYIGAWYIISFILFFHFKGKLEESNTSDNLQALVWILNPIVQMALLVILGIIFYIIDIW